MRPRASYAYISVRPRGRGGVLASTSLPSMPTRMERHPGIGSAAGWVNFLACASEVLLANSGTSGVDVQLLARRERQVWSRVPGRLARLSGGAVVLAGPSHRPRPSMLRSFSRFVFFQVGLGAGTHSQKRAAQRQNRQQHPIGVARRGPGGWAR